jgi:hypothetical protein
LVRSHSRQVDKFTTRGGGHYSEQDTTRWASPQRDREDARAIFGRRPLAKADGKKDPALLDQQRVGADERGIILHSWSLPAKNLRSHPGASLLTDALTKNSSNRQNRMLDH